MARARGILKGSILRNAHCQGLGTSLSAERQELKGKSQKRAPGLWEAATAPLLPPSRGG